MAGRSTKTTEQRFWSKVDRGDGSGCWLWTADLNRTGYGRINVNRRVWLAHRLSFVINVGPVPAKLFVLHACDTPACVRPDHLWLGTQADNMRDAATKGRTARGDKVGCYTHPESRPRGERHWSRRMPERAQRGDEHWTRRMPERVPRGDMAGLRKHPESVVRGEARLNSKLNEEKVREIRRRRARGEKVRGLAQMFGVPPQRIYKVCLRQIWAHVA